MIAEEQKEEKHKWSKERKKGGEGKVGIYFEKENI